MTRESEKLNMAMTSIAPLVTTESKFSSISIDELLEKDFPLQRWVVDRLVPLNGLTIISALPSSYKSWFSLMLAIKVAGGKMLFDTFATEKMGVLIVDEENHESIIADRATMLLELDGLNIRIVSRKGFILNDRNVTDLITEAKSYDVGLIIFDSLVRIHNQDENKATDMNQVFMQLQFHLASICSPVSSSYSDSIQSYYPSS